MGPSLCDGKSLDDSATAAEVMLQLYSIVKNTNPFVQKLIKMTLDYYKSKHSTYKKEHSPGTSGNPGTLSR